MGIPLKAETNGSAGAKNILTKKEIEECDGIIVAADKNVEMARFDGKPVISTKVADGIHKPKELIKKSKVVKFLFTIIMVELLLQVMKLKVKALVKSFIST